MALGFSSCLVSVSGHFDWVLIIGGERDVRGLLIVVGLGVMSRRFWMSWLKSGNQTWIRIRGQSMYSLCCGR